MGITDEKGQVAQQHPRIMPVSRLGRPGASGSIRRTMNLERRGRFMGGGVRMKEVGTAQASHGNRGMGTASGADESRIIPYVPPLRRFCERRCTAV